MYVRAGGHTLQGSLGDALHALRCAAGYNIRWLLRAITRLGLKWLFRALSVMITYAMCMLHAMLVAPKALRAHGKSSSNAHPGFTLSMWAAVR